MNAPLIPTCLESVADPDAGSFTLGQAAGGVVLALRGLPLTPAERMLLLTMALAREVLDSAPGQEARTLEYLQYRAGRLIGMELGDRAGLAAMPSKGNA